MINSVVGITICGPTTWTASTGSTTTCLRLPLHSNHGDYISFQLGENMRFNIGLHDGVNGTIPRTPTG